MSTSLSDLFYEYGSVLTKHNSSSKRVGERRFKSFFGVSPAICAKLWLLTKPRLTPDVREIHLLWSLLFLKCYHTEHVNRSIASCDEKTFRTKVWKVVESLAFIKVVRFVMFLFVILILTLHFPSG